MCLNTATKETETNGEVQTIINDWPKNWKNILQEKLKNEYKKLRNSIELQEKSKRIGQDNGNNGDFGDRAFCGQEKEKNELFLSRDRDQLRRIINALKNISDPNFGFCEECHQRMSWDRITEVPWSKHCPECKNNDHNCNCNGNGKSESWRRRGVQAGSW